MSIYFLRHIKTVYNRDNIISGIADAETLPGQALLYDPALPFFDCILCSPLLRCRETVKLLPQDLKSNIIYLDALKERDLGILEGVKRSTAMYQYPDLFINSKLNVSKPIPDAESIEDVQRRLRAEVLPLLRAHIHENILICSHNQTLKILYALLYGIEIDNQFWHDTNFVNGKITALQKP